MIPPLIDPKEKWTRRFAWLPIRSTTTRKWIWLRNYWQIEVWMDSWGNQPIKGLTWHRIMSDKELLIEQIRNPRR